ncbi:MAG: efflux RND transporter permease subunit, partial [Alphaproteobacteria bacterium]
MKGMVSWWARNGVAANLLMAGILIMGVLAFLSLEREVWPPFRAHEVEIIVPWPGAAPQEVEEQIVLRIEESLVDLENMERIRSTAFENRARIIIEANPRVDIAEFINEVKLRVDSISTLPSDIEPPRVRERIFRNTLMLLAVYGDAGEKKLKRAVDRARDELAMQPGASMVGVFGIRQEEVAVELSESAMRRYGLTFDEVVRAIRASSVNLSSGTVRTGTGEVQLRARNLADTREEFEKIVVRQTGDGAVIKVGDVATVTDAFVDQESIRRYNGKPGAVLAVESTDTVNVVRTSESVRKWLDEPKPWLPDGVVIEEFWDLSKPYFDRMETISNSAFYGLLLVLIVLVLFLRPKVALWVSVGIATAFAGAFIFLPANDVSLNMLSLFSFLLVIGIVVDDAIIVGEAIHRQVEQGKRGVEASIVGTQLVLKPVVFAVLTTMIAFAPWMFLSGAEVQIVRQISLVVIFALTFSLIEALLILPSHLSGLKPQGEGFIIRFQRRVADSVIVFAEKIYRPIVRGAVQRRWLTASIFASMFAIALTLSSTGWVKQAFQGEFESELLRVQIEFPDGTPFARIEDVTARFEQALGQVAEEGRQHAANGGSEWLQGWYVFAGGNQLNSWIKLAPAEKRAKPARAITNRVRELVGEIPDAEELSFDFTFNDPDKTVRFSVSARDLDELRSAVDELKAQLRTYDQLFDVRDDLTSTTDEIRIKLKPGAEKLGLTLRDVSRQVRQAYYGEEVQRLPREGDDVKVMVRYERSARRSLDSLKNFRVRTSDGREVPLFAVAEIEFAPGLPRINRRERQRSAVVVADMKGENRREIIRDLEKNFFPDWESRHPSVTRGALGATEAEQQFLSE